MASPEFEATKAAIIELREQMEGDVQQRAGDELIREWATVPDGITIAQTYAGGCRAYWNDPDGGALDAVLLYLHGGGYVTGSPRSHERLVGHLATAVGCRALSLDYRLAPEHPHPAAVEDATAAYKWLLEQGYSPEKVAISGDSAGGGLAIAALVPIREKGLPQPAAAAALSPWTDLEATGASVTANADVDLMVTMDLMLEMVEHFLDGQNARLPLVSPIHADLQGVAPLYIQVGGDEMLLDDSTRVAENAEAAGVEVKLDVFPEMQHVFQGFVGNVPEATEAVERLGVWLREKLALVGSRETVNA